MRRVLRLPPVGTLRWWSHLGVEGLARGLARARVLPQPGRRSLEALAQSGRAAPRDATIDPAEDVAVSPPAIRIEETPGRFDTQLATVLSGYRTSACGTWTLPNARFTFPAGLVTVDGVVPEETLVQRIWPHSYQYVPLAKIGRADAVSVAPGCVFAFPHWNNVYHWLVAMLPLALTLRDETELPLYVPANGPPFTADSLDFLGLRDRCVALDDGVYTCEELVVASLPGHGLDRPSPRHVQRIRQALLERLPHDATAARRLYISRDDAPDRRVLNEGELVAALVELGFEKVTLGAQPFAEQLRLFAEAEIVIGAHGAGLANTIVCREGTWLLELVGDKVVNPMYAALASLVGLRYGYLRVADSYRDHIVDVDAVLGAARTALSDVTPAVGAKAPT